MKDLVSIIILNYNTPDITLNCINSILKNTNKINFEIVLVDNGSDKSSQKLFKKKLFGIKNINLIYSKKNLGFGSGNNLGVENSKGNFLFFINSDTLIYENSVKLLFDEYYRLSKINKIGFIQPRLYLNEDHSLLQQTNSKIPSVFNLIQENLVLLQKIRSTHFIDFKYSYWNRNNSRYVEAVCGAAMFCKKSFFHEVGKFDKRFFLYFEEYDICKRAILNGYKNYFTIKTSIIHLQNKSPNPTINKRLVYLLSLIKFITKKY
jgi:GT2 family glycosyltransferase